MTEEKAIKDNRTKVELQIIPCSKKVVHDKPGAAVLDHESQDDPCTGKIVLTITCDGSKLTKADAGYHVEAEQEIWVTTRINKALENKIPELELIINEKCSSKVTKAECEKS